MFRDLAADAEEDLTIARAAIVMFERAGQQGLGSLDISAVLQLRVEQQV